MLDIPLLRACVKHQEVLEQLIAPPRIVLDRDSLADAVQLFASYSELLDRSQRRLLFKAARVAHPETPAIGSFLTALIQAALARGYLLKQAVDLAGRVNHVPLPSDNPEQLRYEVGSHSRPVDRAEDLDSAIIRLNKLLDLHFKDWPQEAVPSKEDALASHQQGETQKLSEAFAEIVGIDPVAWERRVEETRPKKSSDESKT